MFVPSQNKKIAAMALAVFMVSFSLMMFFLGNAENLNQTATNVLHLGEEESAEMKLEGPGFITNVEGELIYASEGFCEIMAGNCSEIVDGKIFEYINAKELPDFVSIFSELVASGEKKEVIGPFRVLASDKEKLVLLSAQPVKDGDGKVSTIIFVTKNLTEQAEELKEVKEEIKEDFKWLKNVYPKIKDFKEDKEDGKLLVDKISYKEE